MIDTVKFSDDFPIPNYMKAWVLNKQGELKLTNKKVIFPGKSEVLIRIDAVAICGNYCCTWSIC